MRPAMGARLDCGTTAPAHFMASLCDHGPCGPQCKLRGDRPVADHVEGTKATWVWVTLTKNRRTLILWHLLPCDIGYTIVGAHSRL